MDFFNKLGDSIQNVGKEVTKKTKDLGETMTLNNQIKENETALNNTYQQLGKMYFEAYKEEAKERFIKEVSDIESFIEKINSDKAQLRAIKGTKLCKECGAEVEAQFPRCPMCGAEVETPKKEESANVGADNAETVAGVFCTACGAKLMEGAKFCGKCGSKL